MGCADADEEAPGGGGKWSVGGNLPRHCGRGNAGVVGLRGTKLPARSSARRLKRGMDESWVAGRSACGANGAVGDLGRNWLSRGVETRAATKPPTRAEGVLARARGVGGGAWAGSKGCCRCGSSVAIADCESTHTPTRRNEQPRLGLPNQPGFPPDRPPRRANLQDCVRHRCLVSQIASSPRYPTVLLTQTQQA